MIPRVTIILVFCALCGTTPTAAVNEPSPLALEATIALPNTSGRIDHMDVDLTRKRLFVAELGNGSVDVIDLTSRKVIHRIVDMDEPQGVVYVPNRDLLAIACGGDGTLRVFSGKDFSLRGVIHLGEDADNARLDPRTGNVIVGYGSGGLAIIDPAKPARLADIRLPGHPEGFQLQASTGQAYVNVPDANQIDVADLRSGNLVAQWTPTHLSSNFPMALGGGGTVAVAFRAPPRLVLFDPANGRILSITNICSDGDDVFYDADRKRYYVSCGSGAIGIFQATDTNLYPIARISTSWGARTSLFVPQLDRLFLAVRAGLLRSDASIQIFRPGP